MSDQEILAMDKVPPRAAAKYLSESLLSVHYGLQQRTAPYGYAVKHPGGKWTYNISPGLLVAYKRGTLKIEVQAS
ncbi:hypothetical protein [Caproiciproducens sp. CPB-2]|uniref:hypothetical protein n=1 Tax=Caproiciproducens sp. CPB-2 TaxID=3030017 RepID=UPI0023D9E7EE|nr:hypothetical protein [Caproiciproducens sp. CPB-2]MDF1495189.1 hypothetical protein [Caproiciproducens sp. CPB-2]